MMEREKKIMCPKNLPKCCITTSISQAIQSSALSAPRTPHLQELLVQMSWLSNSFFQNVNSAWQPTTLYIFNAVWMVRNINRRFVVQSLTWLANLFGSLLQSNLPSIHQAKMKTLTSNICIFNEMFERFYGMLCESGAKCVIVHFQKIRRMLRGYEVRYL